MYGGNFIFRFGFSENKIKTILNEHLSRLVQSILIFKDEIIIKVIRDSVRDSGDDKDYQSIGIIMLKKLPIEIHAYDFWKKSENIETLGKLIGIISKLSDDEIIRLFSFK